jgi:LuxR family maltose regulon positive regulatory protein
VVDYLVEEVLQRQPENIQAFLLRTSILDRMCGPLCDAVCSAGKPLLTLPAASGQETLEYLERANLFIISLDNERHWYRYHHLFGDLLRQRLQQKLHKQAAAATGEAGVEIAEYHRCASIWYEDNGLDFEAFQHAAAANDVERAERLIEGKGMPLHMRGAATAIIDWLGSLPVKVLDARPSLWVKRGTLALVMGRTSGVDESLQAAEAALQGAELNDRNRDLIGQIAAARATLALTHYQADNMLAQSRRALEYLHPNDLTFRTTATWALGEGYYFQGDRGAASRAFTEAVALGGLSGDIFSTILAIFSLAQVQEVDNQLYAAAETYRHGLRLFGDFPQPNASEAHLGLARICYEWNDLAAAQQHAQQSLQLARQYDRLIDRFVICEVFLARLCLARGDVTGAEAILTEADQSTRQKNFVYRLSEVAAVQVLLLLHQGHLTAAAHLAQTFDLPISQARVHLAQGDPAAALAVLAVFRQQVEAREWADERLKAMVLQSVALYAQGEKDQAIKVLIEALEVAEPGGFIRIFVDEGAPMAQLLSGVAALGIKSGYTGRLLAAFEAEMKMGEIRGGPAQSQGLIEPLSPRELEVLRLIAMGLSNREICEKLFLALNTIKGHNRIIFDKLQVQSRTEAVARARELGLI